MANGLQEKLQTTTKKLKVPVTNLDRKYILDLLDGEQRLMPYLYMWHQNHKRFLDVAHYLHKNNIRGKILLQYIKSVSLDMAGTENFIWAPFEKILSYIDGGQVRTMGMRGWTK